MANVKPLEGLRVLDFSRVLAGPLCTQSLGDMGADVIKIESTQGGDETRSWPPCHGEGFGAVFLAVNRNKRSVAIDLKTEAGRAIVYKLAPECDVVVENFSTGVADRLKIGAADLQTINKKLIYCTISGYGRSGPLKNSGGYDVILQAFSGMMSLTGDATSGHIRIPISPVDQVTGLNATNGILAALIKRGRTGVGGTVEVSLLDTAASLLNYSFQSFWERGVQPMKWGSSHESLCPYQAFDALDGPVMIGVANDNLWRKFCPIADLRDMGADNRFSTTSGRATHRAEVVERVQAAVKRKPVAFWVEKLSNIGVPVSGINTLSQMLDHPQTKARDIVVDYGFGDGSRVKAIANPVIMDDEARTAGRRPPALGEHTAEVLLELGWNAEQIAQLLSEKAIATVATPPPSVLPVVTAAAAPR
jgi:crotonobetainyl-CoA:carnitine CoA-transferase CaiB-like acyl-CoA transferase